MVHMEQLGTIRRRFTITAVHEGNILSAGLRRLKGAELDSYPFNRDIVIKSENKHPICAVQRNCADRTAQRNCLSVSHCPNVCCLPGGRNRTDFRPAVIVQRSRNAILSGHIGNAERFFQICHGDTLPGACAGIAEC